MSTSTNDKSFNFDDTFPNNWSKILTLIQNWNEENKHFSVVLAMSLKSYT